MQPKIFALLMFWSLMIANDVHSQTNLSSATIVIVNANVHTMDQAVPVAQAVAIYGNRIMALGSNNEIRKLARRDTRVIDAKGQLVMPGFNDAHVHFLSGGFQLASVDLRDADSPAEFASRIKLFAGRLPANRW